MYEDKTPESIKTAILEGLQSDLDKREGSFADDMAGPMAVELYKLYGSLNAVQHIVWVDETSGPYLDMAGEDIGIEPRKPAAPATVTLEITGKAGYLIPAGAAFFTADQIYFETLEDALIPEAGVAEVAARAKEPGSGGNVAEQTILHIAGRDDRVAGVTNPAPAMGGADAESDASLYERIRIARQRPSTSGNKADYEKWALEVPGVGAVRVYPLHEGPGTVGVMIADESRQPVDDAVVRSCWEHIEQVRPIGPEVKVWSAETVPVNVSATVRLEEGANITAITEAFRQVLREHLRAVALAEYEVRYNRIGALLMSVDGVLDYTGLLLNGRAESVLLTQEEVPTDGEVTLTWH